MRDPQRFTHDRFMLANMKKDGVTLRVIEYDTVLHSFHYMEECVNGEVLALISPEEKYALDRRLLSIYLRHAVYRPEWRYIESSGIHTVDLIFHGWY